MVQSSVAYNEKGEYAVKPNLNIEVKGEYNLGCAIESDCKGVQAIRP